MLRISATSESCRNRGPSIAMQSPIASHRSVGTVHNVDRRSLGALGPVDNQSRAGIRSATMNFFFERFDGGGLGDGARVCACGPAGHATLARPPAGALGSVPP